MAATIAVKHLGLAAYIQINGVPLVEFRDGMFILATPTPLEEWRVRYANSCCQKHDAKVCELRHFIKR